MDGRGDDRRDWKIKKSGSTEDQKTDDMTPFTQSKSRTYAVIVKRRCQYCAIFV